MQVQPDVTTSSTADPVFVAMKPNTANLQIPTSNEIAELEIAVV